jgi:hypothetical protein
MKLLTKINKIDTAHSNISLQHTEAQNLINGLNTGDLQGKVNNVNNFNTSVEDNKNTIAANLTDFTSTYTNFKQRKNELFGNEGDKNDNGSIAEITNKLNKQQEQHDALLGEINKLMPNATTVAIANSFRKKAKNFVITRILWEAITIAIFSAGLYYDPVNNSV